MSFIRDPNDEDFYTIDWTARLDESDIASVAFTVLAGQIVIGSDEHAPTHDEKSCTVWLAWCDVSDDRSRVECLVTTADSPPRKLSFEFEIYTR